MKSFPCVCGNELFFASSFCLKCRREAGMCPVCRQVVPLVAESQRTLVGHFRHELGHYFWARLVEGCRDDACRALFGDERNPSYSDALELYYQQGAKPNWPEQFVTPYASMHPWEDFAETFGIYLDMVSVLDTARHFKMSSCRLDEFDLMVKSYTRIGLIANEFNRDMGLLDLVPEVFVPAVVEKLRFIHSLRTVPSVAAASQSHPVSRA